MAKKILLFSVCILFLSTAPVFAQNSNRFDFKSSYGVTVTYSPGSSHILIGRAQGRMITTAGFEYDRRLFEKRGLKLDFVGEVDPVFHESDPAISGIEETYNGYTTKIMYSHLSRILQSHVGIVGQDCTMFYPACVPEYGIQGPNEITYGLAAAPLGLRAVLRPKHRIQPTFAVNVGVLITQRAVPIDSAAAFNYQFSLGPGIDVFASEQSSFRIEYLYRHISNGNAKANPGIDQGVFRFAWIYHH